MHRNLLHSYTLMMKNLKEKLWKHSHLPLQQKKKNKRNTNWKGRNKTVTICRTILYIKNPKDATRKLLELIHGYGNVAWYKFNAQKSLAFLYINEEKSEREIKEAFPFTTARKRIKYLRVNLPRETKDLYAGNYKTLMNEFKDDTHRWETYTMFRNWKNQYCENDYTTQSNLHIQGNLSQIIHDIFHRTRTNNPKIYVDP